MMRLGGLLLCVTLAAALGGSVMASPAKDQYSGVYFAGEGDAEYLGMLDKAARMFRPDPALQNLSMLYYPGWNGLVEGPTWDAWWIQNSYGATLSILPFLQEPWITFLRNSHDLWFDQMGDGKRKGGNDWVGPDGCLCDCARPGWIMYRQGDGRTDIHDWGVEFTAAGVLMQSEMILVAHDPDLARRYLPKLERCAAFIDSRRDPKTDLYMVGPAGNLLAPGFAGWKKPDGTYGRAYHAGVSVTFIAALQRLAEVEKLAGRQEQAVGYRRLRARALKGLARLREAEGYLVCSEDPDGTRHGVFGAAKHGYFEASPNHDAVALRVVDDRQAETIMAKIDSIPELRPFGFILPNYPSYDDMYEKPEGLWGYGTWVNGGHWSTCEARAYLAYYRTGRYDALRRSFRHLLTFAERFRMDNPLVGRGSDVYQPNQPINLCYDTLAPGAALMRGLFQYLYTADALTLEPHIPPTITRLVQREPVCWGAKRITVSTRGNGAIRSVSINGKVRRAGSPSRVILKWADLPDVAHVELVLSGAPTGGQPVLKPIPTAGAELVEMAPEAARLGRFVLALDPRQAASTYPLAHARLVLDAIRTIAARRAGQAAGEIRPLADARSQPAADQSYVEAARRLYDGLDQAMKGYASRGDQASVKIAAAWADAATAAPGK